MKAAVLDQVGDTTPDQGDDVTTTDVTRQIVAF